MIFRMLPKSVTLNYLERRNGPYSALFHRIRVRCRRKKVHVRYLISCEFLVFIYAKVAYGYAY